MQRKKEEERRLQLIIDQLQTKKAVPTAMVTSKQYENQMLQQEITLLKNSLKEEEEIRKRLEMKLKQKNFVKEQMNKSKDKANVKKSSAAKSNETKNEEFVEDHEEDKTKKLFMLKSSTIKKKQIPNNTKNNKKINMKKNKVVVEILVEEENNNIQKTKINTPAMNNQPSIFVSPPSNNNNGINNNNNSFNNSSINSMNNMSSPNNTARSIARALTHDSTPVSTIDKMYSIYSNSTNQRSNQTNGMHAASVPTEYDSKRNDNWYSKDPKTSATPIKDLLHQMNAMSSLDTPGERMSPVKLGLSIQESNQLITPFHNNTTMQTMSTEKKTASSTIQTIQTTIDRNMMNTTRSPTRSPSPQMSHSIFTRHNPFDDDTHDDAHHRPICGICGSLNCKIACYATARKPNGTPVAKRDWGRRDGTHWWLGCGKMKSHIEKMSTEISKLRKEISIRGKF